MSIEQWKAHIKRAQNVFVITGAGVSIASGIPPFRKDKDAVWEQDVMLYATRYYLHHHPVEFWIWYHRTFACLQGAKPNVAHDSLVEIEKWVVSQGKQMQLCTQNIDGLHRIAGSQNLIEIHGRTDVFRCSNDDCVNGAPYGLISATEVDFSHFLQTPSMETIPKCSLCSGTIRPHVLLFDENYDSHLDYNWESLCRALGSAHVVLCIGTSFSVGVTEQIYRFARHTGIPMLGLDPSPTEEYPYVQWTTEKSEVFLPQLKNALTTVS